MSRRYFHSAFNKLSSRFAATNAICNLILKKELKPDYIIPKVFNQDVAPFVAYATAKAAIETGVSKKPLDPEKVKKRTYALTKKYWKI